MSLSELTMAIGRITIEGAYRYESDDMQVPVEMLASFFGNLRKYSLATDNLFRSCHV